MPNWMMIASENERESFCALSSIAVPSTAGRTFEIVVALTGFEPVFPP